MAEKNTRRDKDMDVLFKAILSLETLDECYDFFEDLCTMKELADMVQRVEAAKMLLSGNTYEQIVKNVEISTATISRINRCIQYGSGGYEKILNRAEKASKIKGATPTLLLHYFYTIFLHSILFFLSLLLAKKFHVWCIFFR